MTNEDFPAMFQAADSCAINSQDIYLRLIKADITLLILGPLLAFLPELLPNFSISWLKNIGILMSISTIIVTLLIYLWGKDKAWYGSRAVAESIKTLTWRYITGATPFSIDMSQKDADRKFGNTLQKLMEQESKLNWVYSLDTKVDQITEVMRTQRNKPTCERKNYYIKSRLEEQCQWYTRKAKFNAKRKNLFLFLIIIVQLLTLILIYNAAQILTIIFASVFTSMSHVSVKLSRA